MLVTCQNCHRVYKVADDSLKNGEHTFKCQICGFVWTTFLERDLPETKKEEVVLAAPPSVEENTNTSIEAQTPPESDSVSIESKTTFSEDTMTEELTDASLPTQEETAVQETAETEEPAPLLPQETLISEPTVANLDETLVQVAEILPTPSMPTEDTEIPVEEDISVENTIPELEQFEEMLRQKDYSRFAPKEEEVPIEENLPAEQPVQEEQPEETVYTPSPFEQQDPEMPINFIDPERQEPMAIAPDFPVFEIPTDEKEEEKPLKEEPLMPIRKKGNIFWGLIGYLLFLLIFGGLVLWLGEPLLKRFFPAMTPFYERAYEVYDELSEKAASMKGIEYVHAVYKKIDIRTKAVGEGLNLRDVKTQAVYENNILTLNISGTIVNETTEEKMLPFLYFIVYDKNGNELQNLTNVPKKESLKGRETLAFKGKISHLHPDASKTDITFRKE